MSDLLVLPLHILHHMWYTVEQVLRPENGRTKENVARRMAFLAGM